MYFDWNVVSPLVYFYLCCTFGYWVRECLILNNLYLILALLY